MHENHPKHCVGQLGDAPRVPAQQVTAADARLKCDPPQLSMNLKKGKDPHPQDKIQHLVFTKDARPLPLTLQPLFFLCLFCFLFATISLPVCAFFHSFPRFKGFGTEKTLAFSGFPSFIITIMKGGKLFYLQLELFYLQLRFFAYSPLRCFLDFPTVSKEAQL